MVLLKGTGGEVMRRLWNKLEDTMNDFNVKKKLMLLYICCVIIPIVLTDSIILYIITNEERQEQKYEMKNIAEAVQYNLTNAVDDATNMITNVYMNKAMSDFLEKRYTSDLDYFIASHSFMGGSFYETSFSTSNSSIVMYTDNDTIVNGGHIAQIANIREEEWYKEYKESGRYLSASFYYVGDKEPTAPSKRKVSIVGDLNFQKNADIEKIIKLDLDYSSLTHQIINMKYSMPVYVCNGDRIIFASDSHSNYTQDFERLTGKEKIGYELPWNIYGQEMKILVLKPKHNIFSIIWKQFPLILLMVSINVLLPFVLVIIINKSFTKRLSTLSQAFDEVEADSLKEIDHIQGKDEIGNLMRNYNIMVRKSQELIKTVYKDRLEHQESDIARQKAELLALHSQINPHFLFNVLESIRMHCILKKEEETASMIERLAVLERQNVNWTSDFVEIKGEMNFIEAYLELQKYRFGNRLTYRIEVEPDCETYMIPKLTLVTFVENACVHGVEKKAVPCWIDIRVHEQDGYLCLEIEDTGGGMEEDAVEKSLKQMRECTIDTLREHEHVGMINACLRLKMVTDNRTVFELESEKGIGTFVSIKIPTETLNKL